MNMAMPVITIDGPSGSGKGTIARLLADNLGWHLLDSGALYRSVVHAAQQQGISTHVESDDLVRLAENLPVSFSTIDGNIHTLLNGKSIEAHIRAETIGNIASKIAMMDGIRGSLLRRQRDFAKAPGLVADGRDMGTIVFPDATAKIFLTASPEARANRRYNQLKKKGFYANLSNLLQYIRERDERDTSRATSPLHPAANAYLMDSTGLSIEQVMQRITRYLQDKL